MWRRERRLATLAGSLRASRHLPYECVLVARDARIAVGAVLHECIHRHEAAAPALDVVELGLRLCFRVAAPNLAELLIDLGAVQLAIDAGLREHLLNRFANFLERAHILVVGEAFERLLDAPTRLRVAKP